MPTTIDVRAGRLVLVRTGPGAADAADVFERIAGPGVPEIVERGEDSVAVSWGPLLMSPSDGELAVVAAAVARAHEAGVVHGPFLPEHLRSGPLVAGWGEAPDGWTAEDDVRSFADLLHGPAAARARADVPTTMAALATALAPPAPELRPRAPRRPPRRVPPSAAIVPVLVLVIAGIAVVRPAPPRATPPTTSSSTTTTTTTTTTAARTPSRVITDGVVEHAGRRWAVGVDGDVVVLGRWSCADETTPAVLRPATGQVWRFDRWPDGGGAEVAMPLATVPGAVSLAVDQDDRRCDRVVVIGEAGQRTSVG